MLEANFSEFRPSNMDRFLACSLWQFLPKTTVESEASKESKKKGELEHTRLEAENFLDSEAECSGYYYSVKRSCGGSLYKEIPLEMKIFDEVLKGKPDAFGYDPQEKRLHVLDFKTGDRLVLAEKNYQLMTYAMLVAENFKEWEISSISIAILNTLSDKVFQTKYDSLGILDVLKDEISTALHKVKNRQLYGSTGSHCKFCPSKSYCPLKRDFTALKGYANMDTDKLIFEMKSRRKELSDREIAVKNGVEFSAKLTPLLKERLKRSWREDVEVPQRFFYMKQMSISEAEKTFGYREVEQYTDVKMVRYWGGGISR